MSAVEGCTGETYLVNPDAPEEGTDVRHAEPCPVHDDPRRTLPRHLAARLYRARGAMPYGGIVHAPDFVDLRHGAPYAELDPEALVRYLEELGAVLARVALENDERADRLRVLEHDVAAVRRLFGTES